MNAERPLTASGRWRATLLGLVLCVFASACAYKPGRRPTYGESVAERTIPGTIRITSTPPGAKVYFIHDLTAIQVAAKRRTIDRLDRYEPKAEHILGELVGSTPYRGSFPTGPPYTFQLRRAGYYDFFIDCRPTAYSPAVNVHCRLHPRPQFGAAKNASGAPAAGLPASLPYQDAEADWRPDAPRAPYFGQPRSQSPFPDSGSTIIPQSR